MRAAARCLVLALLAAGLQGAAAEEPAPPPARRASEPAEMPSAPVGAPNLQQLLKESPRWLGVPALQLSDDLLIMQEIIDEVRPEFIIETGTFLGGSTLFYASVLSELGVPGTVITVDLYDRAEIAAAAFPDREARGAYLQRIAAHQDRIVYVTGSSVSPPVVEQIARQVRGHRVLVTLDSNHEAPHVLKELNAYAPLVPVGSYVVVQDTYIGPELGVREPPINAVRAFLQTHPEFQIDKTRERLGHTRYSDGFLKRVAAAPAAP